MGSTFLSLHYHIVFSTKERRPFIKPPWRSKLHEYLGGTVRGLGGIPEIIGGVEDHVHLLVGLRATHCLADFMQELKKASSVWAADKHERDFAWQEGYSALTVSWTHIESVRQYIATQEAHHKKTNFVTELKTLLDKNGVKYEEKYLL
jgi:REP element-mobilizing transposase RayT